MAVKRTPEQEAVVKNRGGTLLVSAAAGSGKTRVLVERLLDRILYEEKNLMSSSSSPSLAPPPRNSGAASPGN